MSDVLRPAPWPGPGGSFASARAVRVFLVDDEPRVLRALTEMIDADPGLEVVGTAGTAETAFFRILAARPDVAVVDMRLPDATGLDLCEDLKFIDGRAPRCIILTAYPNEHDRFHAARAGAAYLAKDLTGMDLIATIKTLTAHAPAEE
ncbi:response regulator transcription factor [Nocardia africana]|uniref:response regulator transcription factor n=1 Tax=Nocardia africana TaxID=134964 RepID=UPI001C3F569E|nr:response regulator [Nocardia africana]MCC3313708.1 response regulator [Nocardia africana]